MKRSDLKNEFDSVVNIVSNTASSIGNDARRFENVIGGLRNRFVPHVLVFRAVGKLVDIIDGELSKENPGPIVTSINSGIDSVSKFIDDTKIAINDKLEDSKEEKIEDLPIDNNLMSGEFAGWDFQDIQG